VYRRMTCSFLFFTCLAVMCFVILLMLQMICDNDSVDQQIEIKILVTANGDVLHNLFCPNGSLFLSSN